MGSMSRRDGVVAATIAVAVGVAVGVGVWPGALSAYAAVKPHIVFKIDSAKIDESSSLIVSTKHSGLVYTANDSGDGPYIYVLNHSGHLVGTTTLSGVDAVDFEAMAAGRDGSLVIGDIGDNDADRDDVVLYKIDQPTTGDHTVKPDMVTLTYADGARNAESLLYDSTTDTATVVSKELLAHVYTTPAHVFDHSTATLRSAAAMPSWATDASWLPAHGAVIVRGYTRARIYSYPSWRYLTSMTLPVQRQGEAIADVPGRGGVIWSGSEGVHSAVWEVPLPALPVVPGYVAPTPAPVTGMPPGSSAGSPSAASGAVGDGGSALPAVAGVAGCALVVAAGAALLAGRRSRGAVLSLDPPDPRL